MNSMNRKLTVRLGLVGLTVLYSGMAMAQAKPACLTPGSAAKHIDINIYSGSKPEFASANLCPGEADAKDGDICMAINEKPDVRFIKKGADKGDWDFVSIELSGDGVNWPGDLPAGAYADFEFGSDDALLTGQPYWREQGDAMLVQNNNCHEFQVHYRIIMKSNKTNEVVRLHPVMDNTGTQ